MWLPNKFVDYFTDIPLELVFKMNPTHFIGSFYLKDRSPKTFFMGPIVDKGNESAIVNVKNSNVVQCCTYYLKSSSQRKKKVYLLSLFVGFLIFAVNKDIYLFILFTPPRGRKVQVILGCSIS